MTTPLPPETSAPLASSTSPNAFKRLYKMSTTAGVGTQDYVAVNTPAVVAVLAGLASAVVLFSNVLFILPVFTLIVGIIAFLQIRKSNGTQTGLPLAIAGIVLALAFSLVVLVQEIQHRSQVARSASQISTTIKKFSDAVAANDFATAYNLFTPNFKQAISLDKFSGELKQIEAVAELGRISKVDWDQDRLEPLDTGDAARDFARAAVRLHFTNPQARPVEATPTFSRAKGATDWQFEAMNPLFQATPPPPPSRGGDAAPPGGE